MESPDSSWSQVSESDENVPAHNENKDLDTVPSPGTPAAKKTRRMCDESVMDSPVDCKIWRKYVSERKAQKVCEEAKQTDSATSRASKLSDSENRIPLVIVIED
jgi:hypothetical protein